ncbi:hypothetical protein [Paenibacillus caui]|uniref:hypothetical protein n=1 Tax=Paenibacillus caui TaxID=2873927 RepID=UPI001CA91CAC|nr:hypothetical protein [Paenibacillus caui]
MLNKKKHFRKTSLLAVIFVVISSIFMFSFLQDEQVKNDIVLDDEYVEGKYIELAPLISEINLMRNIDGGYGYLAEEAQNLPDLYSTYYAIKSIEILKNEKVPLPKQSDFLLIDPNEKNRTSLANLYYYCSIFTNFSDSKDLGTQITNWTVKSSKG